MADKLYTKQGVLLIELDGFVTTADSTVNVIYTDGISDSGHISDCNGKNIDLSLVRKRFYTMAVKELSANGFDYKVDHGQFETYATKAPTTAGTGLSIVSGDEENHSLVPNEDTECNCRDKAMYEHQDCTCIKLRRHETKLTNLGSKISGSLYCTIDYNNVLPMKSATHVQDGTTTIAFLQSDKGTISFLLKANENLVIEDIMLEDLYAYIIVDAHGISQIEMSFDITGDYCTDNACDEYEFEITYSSDEKIQPSMQYNRPTHKQQSVRSKRSAFFGLETEAEVNSIVSNAMKISEGWANQNRNNIQKLSAIIEQSDLALDKQSRQLSSLYGDLCAMGSQASLASNMIKIEASISENLKVMMEMLNDCSVNTVPSLFSYKYIREICLSNMAADLCDHLAHRMRRLMKCNIKSVHLLETQYLLQFTLTMPNSFKESYSLYKIMTIPVFVNAYHHEIKRLDGLTLLQYTDRTESVLLTDCRYQFDLQICAAVQSDDHIAATCVADVINNATSTACWTDSYRSLADCYAKPFQHGLLVSTRRPLEVHHHSRDRIFNARSSQINGTAVLSNDPHSSQSIACNGMLISTQLSSPKPVEIQHQPHFDWNNTLRSSIDTRLRGRIQEENSDSKQLLNQLNETLYDMNNGFSFDALDLKGTHRYTLISFIITMTLIVLLATVCCLCYCCPCCHCIDWASCCCCACPNMGTTTSYIPNWQFKPRMPTVRRPRNAVDLHLASASTTPMISPSQSGGALSNGSSLMNNTKL